MRRGCRFDFGLFAALLLASAAQAGPGKIVVANDEWTLSNTGFSNAGASATNFVDSVAGWFTGGGSGTFLAYTNNFGFTQSSLATAMSNAGHSYTVSTGVTFDLATLSAYDAVFVGGYTADNAVLTAYVNAGGNVYLAGGTAAFGGGAAGEAAAWNTFLGNFGMEFENQYNGISGNVAISSGHPIFNGVTQLYQDNGSSIINVTGPYAKLLVSQNGDGLYAVFAVPLPATAGLATAGFGLIAFRRNRSIA